MSVSSITDIEMDCFGSGVESLATTCLGPCIGFLVLLDHGQHIFLEHRSPIYLPETINSETVSSCFANVAKHVSDMLPQSTITAVFILGGKADNRYQELQKIIDEMIQIGVDDNNQSSFYKELVRNVKHNEVCFNMDTEEPEDTGESNIDLIVNGYLKEDNLTIYVIQNVTKFAASNVIVGVLSIEVKTNKIRFMVDMSITQDNHKKTQEELDFLGAVMEHFRLCVARLNAEEVKNDVAEELLNNAKQLLKKTKADMEHQTELTSADE